MSFLKILIVSMIIALSLPSAIVFAADSDSKGCAEKRAAIERRIVIAKEKGNAGQLAGLERALDNVTAWCSEDSLKAKAEYEVWEHQQEVAERTRDLDEAKNKGDVAKIAKRERKLSEAQAELEEAKAKLKSLEPSN